MDNIAALPAVALEAAVEVAAVAGVVEALLGVEVHCPPFFITTCA